MNKQEIEKAISYWSEFKAEIKDLRKQNSKVDWDEQEKAVDLAIEALNKNTKTNIYKIADHYGKDPQLSMLQEECAELIQAVSKYNRTGNFDKIIEEISDVEVMIEQIKYLFNCSDNVEKVKEEKIKRQLERIKGNETENHLWS